MDGNFEERLAAVERALTDGDHTLSALTADAEAINKLEAVEADVEDLTDRVAELEAATQALRGYVGNVRAVNEEVEQRADHAISKAERAHDAATDHRDNGPASDRTPPASTEDTLRSSMRGSVADTVTDSETFETPRTDELRTEPESLAKQPEQKAAGQPGLATDSPTETPGLVARIRALL